MNNGGREEDPRLLGPEEGRGARWKVLSCLVLVPPPQPSPKSKGTLLSPGLPAGPHNLPISYLQSSAHILPLQEAFPHHSRSIITPASNVCSVVLSRHVPDSTGT